MLDAGTVVCAGVTPGRRGESFRGIPVYNTVREARDRHPEINASFILVPAALAKDAAFEAIDAGIPTIHFMPERVPHQDTMELIAYARERGCLFVGPNSPGILSPGKATLGGLGGRIEMMNTAFTPGPIGIISRSGGNTMTIAYYLTKAGFGTSTAVGVGSDCDHRNSWSMVPSARRGRSCSSASKPTRKPKRSCVTAKSAAATKKARPNCCAPAVSPSP